MITILMAIIVILLIIMITLNRTITYVVWRIGAKDKQQSSEKIVAFQVIMQWHTHSLKLPYLETSHGASSNEELEGKGVEARPGKGATEAGLRGGRWGQD